MCSKGNFLPKVTIGSPKPPGGGGTDPAVANAMMEQARAGVKAAQISASAARDVANAQLKGMEKQANASIYASQQAAAAGIIGSALGAHTTTEQIKQMLPHESGAATIASWELAEKWNKTIQMRQQGYSDVAIEYALSGKSGRTLHADAQWSSLRMGELAKQHTVQSVQMFGIKSSSNPHGVSISEDDWIRLHTMKKAEAALQVDPAQAAMRQEAFQKWEAQMRSKGLGLMVDIYKNPQLAGSHLKSMKGKDPILDPSLSPLLQGLNQKPPDGVPQTTNWGQVWGALTKGEQNPMTDQVKKLEQMGVIDKYGMVNSGEILKHIPPELQEPLAFDPYHQIGDMDKARLLDDYKKFSEMKVDEKLIREEQLAPGVTRKVKMNPDGTIAGHVMEGYMENAMGQKVFMSMAGSRMQEWMDMQSQFLSGMGPMFPGMLAPVTTEELNGKMHPGFWGDNLMAKPNQGTTGPTKKPASSSQPSAPKQSQPKAPTNSAPSVMAGLSPMGNPAASAGGAPLAAGE